MRIKCLNIINNLYVNHNRIINIQDFNSEKLSIVRNKNNKIHVYYDHNPLFFTISGLKGYFEEHDYEKDIIFGSKKIKYLTIIFINEYQKFMYKDILKKINKNINRNYVKIKFESKDDDIPLNILVDIHNLVLSIRYQRVYLNNCRYNLFCEKIQVQDDTK